MDQSNDYVKKLNSNPIRTLPKTGKIGIETSTSLNAELVAGRKIAAPTGSGTAVITGTGSSVPAGGASIVAGFAGTNYVSDSDVGTFNISGRGTGLRLNITANSDTEISAVQIVEGGFGYRVGDVVGIETSSVTGNTGLGAQIKIESIHHKNMIFVTNIQGSTNFTQNLGQNLRYYANDGTITTSSLEILSVDIDNVGVNKGNVMKVNHFDHGMYSSTNKVKISDIEPNTSTTTITTDIKSDASDTNVNVASTDTFNEFEGLLVDTNNPGYALIGNEIIKYVSVGTGTLNISSDGRGLNGTTALDHNSGTQIRKYELSGVSLRRINDVTHNISSLGLEQDSYHVEIDRTSANDSVIEIQTLQQCQNYLFLLMNLLEEKMYYLLKIFYLMRLFHHMILSLLPVEMNLYLQIYPHL